MLIYADLNYQQKFILEWDSAILTFNSILECWIRDAQKGEGLEPKVKVSCVKKEWEGVVKDFSTKGEGLGLGHSQEHQSHKDQSHKHLLTEGWPQSPNE